MSESELTRSQGDVRNYCTFHRLQRWLLAASFVKIALLAGMIFGRSTSVNGLDNRLGPNHACTRPGCGGC